MTEQEVHYTVERCEGGVCHSGPDDIYMKAGDAIKWGKTIIVGRFLAEPGPFPSHSVRVLRSSDDRVIWEATETRDAV